MKKSLFAVVSVMIFGTTNACARQSQKSVSLEKVESLQPGGSYLNHRNMRAVRDFTARYAEVENVRWADVENGSIVRFTEDSISCWAAYDLKGNWKFSIRKYEEEKMPKYVRHQVKSQYYDYDITVVEEIIRPGAKLVYVVHLQDEAGWINLQVCDGEMVVTEKFLKKPKRR